MKRYETPELVVYGRLVDITAGQNTAGAQDGGSGGPKTKPTGSG